MDTEPKKTKKKKETPKYESYWDLWWKYIVDDNSLIRVWKKDEKSN